MTDVTHSKIDDLNAIDGYFEKVSMVQVAASLGISAFGISIVDLDPGADECPEHYTLSPDHIVRVGASVKRKVTPGPDGLRLAGARSHAGRGVRHRWHPVVTRVTPAWPSYFNSRKNSSRSMPASEMMPASVPRFTSRACTGTDTTWAFSGCVK